MRHLVSKGMRLRKPRYVSVQLRNEVYDFLSDQASSVSCSVPVLIRGILEDFFDQNSSPDRSDPPKGGDPDVL